MADGPTHPFTRAGLELIHLWMHESLDVLIDHIARMPPRTFTRRVTGMAYPTLRDQLVHLLEVEAAWIGRVQGQVHTAWDVSHYPTVSTVVAAKREVVEATRVCLAALSEDALNEVVPNMPADWIGPPRDPAAVLHHIVTHAFHHKGQIVATCRRLRHPAPDTDLQRG